MNPTEIMSDLIKRTEYEVRENGAGCFGSAVVVDGEVVAYGFNRVGLDQDPTAHGEVVAIRNASKILGLRYPKGTTLYTTSQSCPMCVAAALWAGIDKIYYGASCEFDKTIGMGDGHVYSYLRGDADPKVMQQIQLESDAAEKMLNSLFNK